MVQSLLQNTSASLQGLWLLGPTVVGHAWTFSYQLDKDSVSEPSWAARLALFSALWAHVGWEDCKMSGAIATASLNVNSSGTRPSTWKKCSTWYVSEQALGKEMQLQPATRSFSTPPTRQRCFVLAVLWLSIGLQQSINRSCRHIDCPEKSAERGSLIFTGKHWSMPPISARPYDVVIWGTTGVVGRLVAEHITRDYQANFSNTKVLCKVKSPQDKWCACDTATEQLCQDNGHLKLKCTALSNWLLFDVLLLSWGSLRDQKYQFFPTLGVDKPKALYSTGNGTCAVFENRPVLISLRFKRSRG